ncbi:MAG: hypothetical protein A2Y71_00010 [Bacteroidetes bacterium RBG_13_42_15]|nr:MAG: hypothetical protein A2Y71_00010 [Bacteroidetes bacterium RBG_13_42_15]
MKKIFFISFLLISASNLLHAQTILLQEDFNTASGTTTPAGWTIQTITGDPAMDVWHFDNPGSRTANVPVMSKFACFDSDYYSDNGLAEQVYLVSPEFDATTTNYIILEFDQFFLSGNYGTCVVEVYNGTSWVSIYSNYLTTSNPQHSIFDITNHIKNITNAKLRFKWTGNYSWYWIIDNVEVKVVIPPLTDQTEMSFTGVSNSSVAWGDYDNDGYMDILLSGSSSSGYISKIYRNNGNSTFTEQTDISLIGIYMGCVAWADYDNDGYLDILLTGSSSSGYISKIYHNNGEGNFTEQTSINLTGVGYSSVAWGDYDNDGFPDILLTGYSTTGQISKIYRNNGDATFTEQTAISLAKVYRGSVGWGDYDNDGYLDILLTGDSGSAGLISKIYRNNGNSNFDEQTDIILPKVYRCSVAWGDYDNNGYLDILLSGQEGWPSNSFITRIYKNNGNNIFKEQISINLPGVIYSSVSWGDYDNDGYLDILLTGTTNEFGSGAVSKTYHNNGNGTFTEQADIILPKVYQGSAAWGDYDNDSDLDLLLTGFSIAKVYRNDVEKTNSSPLSPISSTPEINNAQVVLSWETATDAETPSEGLSYNVRIGSTSGGIDVISPHSAADGKRRIVSLGNVQSDSRMILNNMKRGTYYWSVQAIDNAFTGGAFSQEQSFTISAEVQASNIISLEKKTTWITTQWNRGNGTKCVVFVRKGESGIVPLTNGTIYSSNENFGSGSVVGDWYCVFNGTGNSIRVTNLLPGTSYVFQVIEYDGSAGNEIYFQTAGVGNPSVFKTTPFVEQTGITLTGVNQSRVAWGDYDNDGYLDILLTGCTEWSSGAVSKIYHNNGNGTFTEQTGILLTGVFRGSVAWGDYDNDGYLDILLTGTTNGSSSGAISKIYRNNGSGTFTEQTGISLLCVYNSSAAWGDYDNDGYADILLTGYSNSGSISKIYHNNGDGNFSEDISITLVGVSESSVAWGDYDNDKYLDILLTGYASSGYVSKIYHNNGDATFTEQSNINLTGVSYGSVAWGDYDNDGHLDIILTGSSMFGRISKIYHNNGDATFTEQSNINLTCVDYGWVAWGDYDNDGYLDILLTGVVDNSANRTSKIYRNNGDGTFTEQKDIILTGVYFSSVAWGDYNNDGFLDFVLSGYGITKIYRNNGESPNTIPSEPVSKTPEISNTQIVLSWEPAIDAETTDSGLSYNVRIGTIPGGIDIVCPHSGTDGKRRIVSQGNAQTNRAIVLDKMKNGTYYWSVQAVDNAFAGGAFSQEKSFTITAEEQASNIDILQSDSTSITAKWSRGNGTKCIVFVREGNSGSVSLANNTTYTDDQSFGSGSAVDDWYCVYNSTGNSVTVTNLTPNSDYRFQVIEYDGAAGYENYFSLSGPGNPAVLKPSPFIEQTSIVLACLYESSVAWGDFDNNGNLDIVLTGYDNNDAYSYLKIYCNYGDNSFTEKASIQFDYASNCSITSGDYDNDGYLDILISGPDVNYNSVSKIYHNNGDGNFTEQTDINLVGFQSGSAAWGDYDNDGYLDILVTGFSDSEEKGTFKIYHNNGDNSFTEQTGISIEGVENGSVAWGDYDNNGYLDILLTGSLGEMNDPGRDCISKVYHNNGNNTFTEEAGISLMNVGNSSAAWGDYDNDGYLDILLTGSYHGAMNESQFSRIYRNNGNNTFTEQSNIILTDIGHSSVAWGDYDNDGDLDILLTGRKDNYLNTISKIYLNNGENSFTEQPFILAGVMEGSAAWGDYDNDGDLDIIITGLNSMNQPVSKIYKNLCDKVNNAPEKSTNLYCEINSSTAVFRWNKVTADETPAESITYNVKIRNSIGTKFFVPTHSGADGFRRMAAMGNAQLDTTFIFNNNFRWDSVFYASIQAIDNSFKGGPFSDEVPFGITPVQPSDMYATSNSNSSLLIKWKRGNGDRCIVFAKQTTTGFAEPINYSSYFSNPIFGEGSPIGTSGWFCIYKGTGDSVLLSGLEPQKLYLIHAIEYQGDNGSEIYATTTPLDNIGLFSTSTIFSEQTNFEIIGASHGSVAWGDYDNDEYVDILVTGRDINYNSHSKIYRNNRDGSFIEQTGILLIGVSQSCAVWGDYDNDGYLDILLIGNTGSGRISKIYHNNGSGSFIDQTEISLTGVEDGHAAWGDYNNDGYLDILLTGYDGSNKISKIYRNNGDGTFSMQKEISLTGVRYSYVAWGDYDNDGYLDILLTGQDNRGSFVTKVYHNNGNGTFNYQSGISLISIVNGSAVWGDYNNDGCLDILITGYFNNTSGGEVSKIYRNNGNGNFSEQVEIVLTGVNNSSSAWGDYDNDGLLDILLSGFYTSVDQGYIYYYITEIYRNNGNNTFTKQNTISLSGLSYCSVAWGDYDNDGDQDILMSGTFNGNYDGAISKIYRNNLIMRAGAPEPNRKPVAPTELSSTITPNCVNLTWSPVTGDETPSKTMSFNLRFKMVDSTNWKFASHAADTGHRRVAAIGNLQLNRSFSQKNLPSGYYHWQVQAVDQGYMGGTWSAIDSFEVRNVQAFYSADEVCLGYPTHFTDQSAATDGIASWKWDFKDGTTSTIQNPVHTYSASGTYNVKLVITDNGGVKDSLEQNVIVRPKPLTGFSAPAVCQGIPVTATNTTNNNGLTISSWEWDFDDGSTSTDQQPAPHGYLNAGDYAIKLKSTASNGCADSVSNIVSVGSYPVAAVTANAPLTFCKGDSVTLSVPYNADYLYTWKVDGTNLTGGDSSKYVPKLTGSYTVEVVNPKGNCTTTSSAVAVTAKDAPVAPLISTEGDLIFCQGDSVVLSVSNTPGYTFQWKLNGGAVGTNSYKYSSKTSGTYTLTVSNSSGCSVNSTNEINVTVNPSPALPTVNISGPTTFCAGSDVDLTVTNNSSYTYQWENNGAALTGDTTNTYTAQTSGIYYLKITNSNGCYTKTENVIVNVLTAPVAPLITASKALEFCQGDSVELSVTNTLNYSYQWRKDGGLVGTSNRYNVKSSGKYSLTVRNTGGCTAEAADTIDVLVNSAPVPGNISLSGPATFCQGGSVTLSVPTSTGYTYKWKNEYGEITGAETNIYTAGTSGSYKLEVSNSSGCMAETPPVSVTVKPSPVKPGITTTNYTEGACPGLDPIRLSVSSAVPGYRYTWIKDGETQYSDTLTFIEFYGKGIYKVKAELGECPAESDPVTITVPDAPEKPIVYIRGPVVWYMAASSKTADRHQWYRNNEVIQGATRYIYVANKTLGTYRVAVGNQNECYTMSDDVTIPTSKSEMTDFYIPPEYLIGEDKDLEENTRLYPNPTSGRVNIEIENEITGDLLVSIFDQNGKELYNFKFEKTTEYFFTELELNGLTAGYYLFTLDLNDRIVTRKVIIE